MKNSKITLFRERKEKMENTRENIGGRAIEKVMGIPFRVKKGECPLIESIANTKELIESLKNTRKETVQVLMEFCRKSKDESIKRLAETIDTLNNTLKTAQENLEALNTELDTKLTTAIREAIFEKKQSSEDETEEKEESVPTSEESEEPSKEGADE